MRTMTPAALPAPAEQTETVGRDLAWQTRTATADFPRPRRSAFPSTRDHRTRALSAVAVDPRSGPMPLAAHAAAATAGLSRDADVSGERPGCPAGSRREAADLRLRRGAAGASDGGDPAGVRRHLDASRAGDGRGENGHDQSRRQPVQDRDGCAIWRTRLPEDKAAWLLNVGRRSVQRARAVRDKGTEALIVAVDGGKIVVSVAAKLANLAPAAQAYAAAVSGQGGAFAKLKRRQMRGSALRGEAAGAA